MADATDPKAEELGKSLAGEMQGKLDTDEAHRLIAESDDVYDAGVLKSLEAQIKSAVLGFNDVAKAADQLGMEKGTGMLQMFKANLPVLAAKVSHRRLLIVPAMETAAVKTYEITGGPDEFVYSGKPQAEFVRELLTMVASTTVGVK